MKSNILSLFLVIAVSTSVKSQWKTQTINDRFEGDVKIAYCYGKSSSKSFPSPIIKFQKVSGENVLYLADSDYFIGDSKNTSIKVVFDNDNRIYSSEDHIVSANSKGILLNNFSLEGKTVSNLELLSMIMKYSKMYIRINNRGNRTDLEFNLSNSSNSLKYIDNTLQTKVRSAIEDGGNKRKVEDAIYKAGKEIGMVPKSYQLFIEIMKEELPTYDSGEIDSIMFSAVKRSFKSLRQVQAYYMKNGVAIGDAGIYTLDESSVFYKNYIRQNDL